MSELVLVTGASGFLGSHVVRQLQAAGFRVRGSVRDPNNEKKVAPLRNLCPGAKHPLQLVKGDLLDEACWKEATQGCTYVAHLATPVTLEQPKNEDELIKPAVEGTLNVLRAARENGVKRVVLTSSIMAIMGNSNEPMNRAYTEKDWSETSNPTMQAYQKSKTLAERAAWQFVKDCGPELVTIHPTLIIGPVLSYSMSPSIKIIKELLERKLPFTVNLNTGVCDVRDVAAAHVTALRSAEALNERHIISTKEMWLSDIGKIMSKEFDSQGYNVTTMTVPNVLIKFMSLFSEEAKTLCPLLGKEKTFSNSRMMESLGIQPTNVEKSIIDMCYSLIEKGIVEKTSKYRGT